MEFAKGQRDCMETAELVDNEMDIDDNATSTIVDECQAVGQEAATLPKRKAGEDENSGARKRARHMMHLTCGSRLSTEIDASRPIDSVLPEIKGMLKVTKGNIKNMSHYFLKTCMGTYKIPEDLTIDELVKKFHCILETYHLLTSPPPVGGEHDLGDGGEVQPSKTRKRKRNPGNWKKNKRRLFRSVGLDYCSTNGKSTIPRKAVKPIACKCHYKCTTVFTETERQVAFKAYWPQEDGLNKDPKQIYTAQRAFIHSMVKASPFRTRYTYHLRKGEETVKVCRDFFLKTLDIDKSTVYQKMNILRIRRMNTQLGAKCTCDEDGPALQVM